MTYYNKLKKLLTLIKENTDKKELKEKIKDEDFSINTNAIGDDIFYKDLLKNDITLLKDYLYNTNTAIDIEVFLYQLRLFYNNTNNKSTKSTSNLIINGNPKISTKYIDNNDKNNKSNTEKHTVNLSKLETTLKLYSNPKISTKYIDKNDKNNKSNTEKHTVNVSKLGTTLKLNSNTEISTNYIDKNDKNNKSNTEKHTVNVSKLGTSIILNNKQKLKVNKTNKNIQNNETNTQEHPVITALNNSILKINTPNPQIKNKESNNNINNSFNVDYNSVVMNNNKKKIILNLLDKQKILIDEIKNNKDKPNYPIFNYPIKIPNKKNNNLSLIDNLNKKYKKINLKKKYKKINLKKNIYHNKMKNNKKLNFYLQNIKGGNAEEYNLNEVNDRKKLKKKLDEINTENKQFFNNSKTIMSIIILSNIINDNTKITNLFLDPNNLKFFFIKINKSNKTNLLNAMFKENNNYIKNYNIKNNYRDITKVMNLDEIIKRDSVYGNKIYKSRNDTYIFIYTLLKILYLEFENIISKITNNESHKMEFKYFYEQGTYNFNGLQKLYENISEDKIKNKYQEINNNVASKLLALLRFRHDRINNDFNHRFGITKASNYESSKHDKINHINDFLDNNIIGNNKNVVFNHLNINKPENFNMEEAIKFNKLDNIHKLQEEHGVEKYTCFFNSIYNPYVSLKEIQRSDPNIKKLQDLLKGQKNNVTIMGLGQSGVGKTSFLLGYEFNGLNEGIVDQLINVNDVTNVSVKEYFLDKDKKPVVKETGPIDKDTLTSYAGSNEALKDKIGLLLLKFLEGGLKIDNNKHIVNKKVRSTPNNKKSSRSHAVIIVNLNSGSNLIVCDLAGVENKFNCNNRTIINFFKKITELYDKKRKKKEKNGENLSFYQFVSSYDWFRPLDTNNITDLENNYNKEYDLINSNLEKIEEGLLVSDEEISKMEEDYTIKKITKNFLLKGKNYKPSKNNFNKIKEYLINFVSKKDDIDLINRLDISYKKDKWWEYLNNALYGKNKKTNYDKLNLGKNELKKIKKNIDKLKSKRNNAKKIIDSTLWKHITTICNFSTAEGTKIINKELQDLGEDLMGEVINSVKIEIEGKKVNPIYRNFITSNCYKLVKEKYELFYTSDNTNNYKSKIFNNLLPSGNNFQNYIVLSNVFDLRNYDFSKLPRNFPPSVPYISLKPFLDNNKSKTEIVENILKALQNYKGYKNYLPEDFLKELNRTDNSYKNLIKYIESLNSITAIGVIETVSNIKHGFFCNKEIFSNSKKEIIESSKVPTVTTGGYYNKYIKYKKKYYDLKYKYT